MTNFIFKSPRRLIKNESIDLGNRMDLANARISLFLKEQRMQRQDLQDIKRMLNKLIINEHLQSQANAYFEDEQKQQRLDAGQEPEPNELEDK